MSNYQEDEYIKREESVDDNSDSSDEQKRKLRDYRDFEQPQGQNFNNIKDSEQNNNKDSKQDGIKQKNKGKNKQNQKAQKQNAQFFQEENNNASLKRKNSRDSIDERDNFVDKKKVETQNDNPQRNKKEDRAKTINKDERNNRNQICQQRLLCGHQCQVNKNIDQVHVHICVTCQEKQKEQQKKQKQPQPYIQKSQSQNCNKTLSCAHKCISESIDNCPMGFHDICEQRQYVGQNLLSHYYCIKDDVSKILELGQISQFLGKFNQLYQSKVKIKMITFVIRREIEIEIFIFKKIFEGKLNSINFQLEDQKLKLKLQRYLSRSDLYFLLDKNQFIFIRNLVLQLIVKDMRLKEPQIFNQFNIQNISEEQVYKIFRYFQGIEICKQLLDCSHICQKGFHLTQCECLQQISYKRKCQHTENIYCKDQSKVMQQKCEQICNKLIPSCSHQCQLICGKHLICECNLTIQYKFKDCSHSIEGLCKDQSKFVCEKFVYKKFTNCNHQKLVKCSDINKVIECSEIIEQTYQNCGHKQKILCSKKQLYLNCQVPVNKCAHKKDIPCYQQNNQCQLICNKLQDCGHQCKRVCHNIKCVCDQKLNYYFKCGHIQNILCSEQLTASCNQQCNKKLKCGHQCQLKCIEPCQCNQMVEHKFECGHKETVKCSDEKKGLVCKAMKQFTFDCNHKEIKQCYEKFSKQCNKRCQKQLQCGHKCIRCCLQSCQCGNEIDQKLKCGHQARICSQLQSQNYSCQEKLTFKKECGHIIDTECQHLNSRLLQKCQEKCQKQLQCMHNCDDICSNKCLTICKKCQQDNNKQQIIQPEIINKSSVIIQNPPLQISQEKVNLIDQQIESKTKLLIEQCNVILKCNHKCRQLKQDDCYCTQLVKYKCFICQKTTQIECQQFSSYVCQNKVFKQCKFCQQQQWIICGQFIQCDCIKYQQVNYVFDKDIEINLCKVILSCNHQCNGTFCTSNLHEMCKYQSTCKHNQIIFCSGRTSCPQCISQNNNINGINLKYLLEQNGFQRNDTFYQYVTLRIFDVLTYNIIQKLIPLWPQIKQLPILSNQNYERNRILLQIFIEDIQFPFKVQLSDIEIIQSKINNLIEYEKQQRKCCTNIFKYSKMKSIENSDFTLTTSELQNL